MNRLVIYSSEDKTLLGAMVDATHFRMEIKPAARSARLGASVRPEVGAVVLLVLAVLLAYSHSWSGPFVFDDIPSVRDNLAIRRLWPPGELLAPSPVAGLTTNGRPVATLTLALNYALGGTEVWSYHAVNLLIHVLAALVLLGLARRTLACMGKNPGEAGMLGFAIALLWAMHPLETEAVTYVAQRTESLMGLFYLLTIYCFLRGATVQDELHSQDASDGASVTGFAGRMSLGGEGATWRTVLWFGLSWLSCLFGMATKEVMVTAPVMVVLYDRTFLSGDFLTAWRRHGRIYLGLACSWLLLGLLMASTGSRGGTAGFDTPVAWWRYALFQFPAVAHYLWLSFWPSPLVFDYGTDLAVRPGQVVLAITVVSVLLGGTTAVFFAPRKYGLGRRALGFAGIWFFGILAPTSSVVPVATQSMAEHRIYLPLAGIIAAAVCGAYAMLKWACRSIRLGVPPVWYFLTWCLAVAMALGVATDNRNADYHSELSLWTDTVAKRPQNADAQYNLGRLLSQEGRSSEAAARYAEAVRLKPDFVLAHNNLALAFSQIGRTQEAIAHCLEAVRWRPDFAPAWNNLGNIYYRAGRAQEAIGSYRKAITLAPDFAEAHNGLALTLAQSGANDEAEQHFQAAVRLKPVFPEAYYNWANALAQAGRIEESSRCYAAAIRLQPVFPEAYFNWGTTLAEARQTTEAIRCFEAALQLKPDFEAARTNLHRLQAAHPSAPGP